MAGAYFANRAHDEAFREAFATPAEPTTVTHQQLLAEMSASLERATAELASIRLLNCTSMASFCNARLSAVEHELANLACAARLAGAMDEECREAFEGAAR